MRKKISIIIPVYNVEPYVERCILSIIEQDVFPDEYEIIAVNDGSTDQSGQILEKLQQAYPFIKIINKENGGLSSARNEGLKHISGDYIFFLDSDDWITDGSMAFLTNWINSVESDIYLWRLDEIYDNGTIKRPKNVLSDNNKILTTEDYLNSHTLISTACQGLFARQIFDKYNIRFKNGFLAEDDDFVVRFFSRAKTIVCTHRSVYCYYQRQGSISKGQEFEKKIIGDRLIMLEELDAYISLFDGRMKTGLQRKLDFLAIDIIRLCIRKRLPEQIINETLSGLKNIGYFPLKTGRIYSIKYLIFKIVFSFPSLIKKPGFFLRKYM
ncbi:glycosyltransferase family 2 protein [Dysgonomonas sp. 216]|uniref:glycosyltransferase family 2 protein n=1 Tax=Dysgonomonas sp. 216 TaxID=2302934 RepID=UPI0013D06C18|nr:glycosyltransferase family 2 protein [Dysgonomonas sp. 216]NDW17687.1 glycosyltransferase family 2 protein [Dysgonomonas sp. 216]